MQQGVKKGVLRPLGLRSSGHVYSSEDEENLGVSVGSKCGTGHQGRTELGELLIRGQ